MPAVRKRLWVIPLKSEWPEDLDGKPSAVPIREERGEEIGRWHVKGRPMSQVLKEVRQIVMLHNVPVREERLDAARQRRKVQLLKLNGKANDTQAIERLRSIGLNSHY